MSVQFRFIGEDFFDTFKDEPVSYTRKATDFQKVDLTFNDFSKSFMIPATEKNNRLFKYYFDPSVVNSFNPFQENKAEMWVNGELYSSGQLTLIKIDIVEGKPRQYTVQFYSETIDLKSALNDNGLDALDFGALDHSATASEVRTYLQGGQVVTGTNMRYVMASVSNYWTWDGLEFVEGVRQINSTNSGDGILNREVRPSIPVSDVMDAIFSNAGFDYEVDFDTEAYYTELYMWIHNGKPFVSEPQQIASARGDYYQYVSSGDIDRLTYPDIVINELKMYSPITNSFIVSSPGLIDYTLTAHFYGRISEPVPEWRYVVNGVPSAWITITTAAPIDYIIPNLTSGDEVYAEIQADSSSDLSFITNRKIELKTTDPSALDYFVTKAYMPTMKCIDFIKGVLFTFNAIMYWDAENRKFVIKHREQWYLDGTTHDITKEVDTSKSQVKPPTFYKQYAFEWEEGKDFRNENYKSANNRGYGGSVFNTGMYAGDTYTNKNPFTPTIWSEVVTEDNKGVITATTDIAAAFCIDQSFAKVESGVRLMYYNGSKAVDATAGTYKVVDFDGTSGGNNSTYNFFTSALVSDSNLNLAYNSELDFKSSGGIELTNSLFTRFYETYIRRIYDQSVRRVSLTAYIPYNKLKSIQLNDTITYNNTEYYIDGIKVDLTTNKAQFDLINKV